MITVFGSINIDQVYHMNAHPAPGETTLGNGYAQVPGGKGANQAVAARRAGAEVKMVGCVGADTNADPALALMRADKIETSDITKSELPTGCASIWVDGNGENSIVVYSGANTSVSADQVSDKQLGQSDYLLLQMEVPAEENWKLLARAKDVKCKTVLNLAPIGDIPESALRNLDYLIVNELEAAALADQHQLDQTDEIELASILAKKFDLCCVLTLGGRGVVAVDGANIIKLPALDVSVVDTTAAGDSFIGGFAAALSEGKSLEKSLQFATVVAGLACTKLGAQSSIPYRDEVVAGFVT
ncbi:hypothetical protein A9Q83_01785 [Alphaproteobacteria bacterium 46_93_T64]|nr:hypothetical protein A9Q83_01785 [Alphaproteobacteria bacterium 46_93_T64]